MGLMVGVVEDGGGARAKRKGSEERRKRERKKERKEGRKMVMRMRISGCEERTHDMRMGWNRIERAESWERFSVQGRLMLHVCLGIRVLACLLASF